MIVSAVIIRFRLVQTREGIHSYTRLMLKIILRRRTCKDTNARIPLLLSLGESGALDIPMGGGRRHGRSGSYDASTLPVPDESSSRDL